MPYILDIIILVIIVFCILRGIHRGAVRTAFALLSFAAALILTFMFASPVTQYIEKQPFGQKMHETIEEALNESISKIISTALPDMTSGIQSDLSIEIPSNFSLDIPNTPESILETLSIPESMKKSLFLQSDFFVRNQDMPAKNAVATTLASTYMKALCTGALFLLLLLLMRVFRFIAEQIFKLPLLKDLNRVIGGVAGLVNGIIVSMLVLSGISLFSAVSDASWLISAKETSLIFKFMYENNILLSAIL